MKRMIVISLVVGLTCLTAVSAEEKPSEGPPQVGKAAPDFELMGSDGKKYKLSDFKGKQPVVVAWYPKAFTGG